MKKDKINLFLLILSVVSITILTIGATYSFFTINAISKANAVSVEAGRVMVGLGVIPKYHDYKLIPMNDSDVMTAYSQECIDDYGNGACLAYDINVYNYGKMQDIVGKIDFSLDGINNLKYLLLDSNGNRYVDITEISSTAANGLSMGNAFTLPEGTMTKPSTKDFVLIIWISNLDKSQNDDDAGGKFNAAVTYSSMSGSRITANVGGMENDSTNSLAQLGGGE